MKKIITILSIVLMLIIIPVSVYMIKSQQDIRKRAAPATTLTLTPATQEVSVGDTITFEAIIETQENQVVAAELHISFDPTKLEGVSITNGPDAPNILTSGIVDNGSAVITVGAENPSQPIHGRARIATLKLKALSPSLSPLSISISPETFIGGLGEGSVNVLSSSIPATIVISEDQNITPTPTPHEEDEDPDIDNDLDDSGNLSDNRIPFDDEEGFESSSSATPSPTMIVSPTPLETKQLDIITPQNSQTVSSGLPIFQGVSSPQATITITIYSDPITAVVTADDNGNWTYTPQENLSPGPHTIIVTTQNPITQETETQTITITVPGGVGGDGNETYPVAGRTENTLLLLFSAAVLFIFGKKLQNI